jgi:N-acetyl-gamma-glutamyl-phosphate/LysW-gamma-L-alpha-aminoadipyl-6-phosphate reductase
MTLHVAIVGGSGYVGGELLRLLTFHPDVEVSQVTSGSRTGHYVHSAHPNLRGAINLRFSDPGDLQACDVLFLALPHGQVARDIERYAALAERVIDCSADFRLRDPADYVRWYGQEHPAPQWLDRFVYGLPERERPNLRQARYASGVGCNAVGVILALGPLADAGWLEEAMVEIKVGSSEAGARANASSHHPERAGAVRVYAPTGHRHLAEIRQALGDIPVHLSVTAIEMVRGVHVTAHAFLHKGQAPDDERDVWALYREAYADEPFVRLVKSRQGLYRYPEPKILAGTNFCDVGFALDAETGRLVVIAALDNMMKGAAGSAVQSMNVMCGLDEQTGLTFPGLHPI